MEAPLDIRRVLEGMHTQSFLGYGLPLNGVVRGYVGFDNADAKRVWTAQDKERLKAIAGLIVNAWERALSDEAARRAKVNFQNFFETIDDLFIIGSMEGRVVFTNSAVSRKLGFSPEELRGMHILDLHPEDKRDAATAILSAMFRGERMLCPLELMRKDGTRLPVETRVWLGDWDGRKCIYGISKDLGSEQAALQKFESIFENNPALMAITSLPDQKIIQVNGAFIEKLGYSKDEILGHAASEMGAFLRRADKLTRARHADHGDARRHGRGYAAEGSRASASAT